ncbi:hypothetical protein ACRWXN_21810, partial [Escherichia coli]
TGPQSIHILRGVRQQQDEPGRFSICSRQAAVVQAIDRFEDKFRGEGLKFEREKAESDLLNHGFTREMAEDALGKQFVQAREEHLELQQQRDNSQDMH